MIGIDSMNVQQVNGVLGIAWKSLELWNLISTFVVFFQVFPQLLTPPILVLLVWICSICSLEWIRFTNLHPIFSNNDHWSRFDSHINLSKSSQNQSFCVQTSLARFDLIASYSWTWNMHKISRFKWFWYFDDFILI